MQGDAAGKREISEGYTSPESSQITDDPRKRRATSSGSRGVANLTPEQLAKKRQNDREAQRAIRERTKNQIESLERRIAELTSQQPYQELQHALRQRDAVEAENLDIRKRLTSALSLLQPALGPQQHTVDLSYSTPQSYSSPGQALVSNCNVSTASNGISPRLGAINSSWNIPPIPDTSFDSRIHTNPSNHRAFDQQRHNLVHGLDMGLERLGLDFLLDGNQRIVKVPLDITGSGQPRLYQDPSLTSTTTEVGSSHQSHHNSRKFLPQKVDYIEAHSASGEIVAHAAPVRNSEPTCPLDNILLDFLRERQQQAVDGVAMPNLVGPAYPSVSSLLNPARSMQSHPLSKVFTDILGTFPDLSTLPEKVAVLYIMFLFMRWQINPTQENYDRLPEWVTPRPSQLFTSHPAWIDHLPWPRMRDKLVRDYNSQEYLFDDFFVPFTMTLSLNWPYEPTDTLLSATGSEELMINPVFERHLRRLENWSLGPAFLQAFPGLADTFKLKSEGNRR